MEQPTAVIKNGVEFLFFDDLTGKVRLINKPEARTVLFTYGKPLDTSEPVLSPMSDDPLDWIILNQLQKLPGLRRDGFRQMNLFEGGVF